MRETLKTNVVFIDTSVFWKSFYAANSPFSELQTLCVKNELRLITTTITLREIEAQISEHAQGQYTALMHLRSKQNALDLLQIEYDKEALSKVTLEFVVKALQSKVSHFFSITKATIVPIPDDATPVVIDKYFKREKPFTEKKKAEFRDAFVIEALKRLPDAPNGIYVVSCDPDFDGADERFHLLASVEQLLSLYNSHTEVANFVRRLIDKNMALICDSIMESISKSDFVSQRGQSFDVAGLYLDIFTVCQTLVFNVRPQQATIQLELVVLCEGDALILGNNFGIGDKVETFSDTLNLEASFMLYFNEDNPDFVDLSAVIVNNGNPIAFDLYSA